MNLTYNSSLSSSPFGLLGKRRNGKENQPPTKSKTTTRGCIKQCLEGYGSTGERDQKHEHATRPDAIAQSVFPDGAIERRDENKRRGLRLHFIIDGHAPTEPDHQLLMHTKLCEPSTKKVG